MMHVHSAISKLWNQQRNLVGILTATNIITISFSYGPLIRRSRRSNQRILEKHQVLINRSKLHLLVSMRNHQASLHHMSYCPIRWSKVSYLADIVFPFAIFESWSNQQTIFSIFMSNPNCCFFFCRPLLCERITVSPISPLEE